MKDPSSSKKLHQEPKRKPKFWIDFNSFATYRNRVEAVIVVSPEYDLHHVVNMLHGPDTARALTLVFTRKEKKFGRRGYSLKQEWEETKFDDGSVLTRKDYSSKKEAEKQK